MKINKQYDENKKAMIRHQIDCYIDQTLTTAANMESLDYFTIEISNHQGKLDVKSTVKNRKKVY